MQGDYQGDFGEIQQAMNATITRLREIVGGIIENADSVSTAASEISAGSSDLSHRTESQAANLEETAAAMEQITSTVRNNAQNAKEANEKSAQASKNAKQGGIVVEQAVNAMQAITSASKKISDIILVIDNIAFQTNLLALNAAVEAARAGEAGKGFAVVASEVRSLAIRSSSASSDIKELIKDSAETVTRGVDFVNQTGESLSEIINSIEQVRNLIEHISQAANEQMLGIEEVNNAISNMDENTQQNAALVEENTAAICSLNNQARQLKRMMEFFNISGHRQEQGGIVNLETGRETIHVPSQSSRPAAKASAESIRQTAALKANGTQGRYRADDDWQEF